MITFDPSSPGQSGLVRADVVGALRHVLSTYGPHVMVHVPTPGDLTPREVREATTETTTVAVAVHLSTSIGDAITRQRDVEETLREYDLTTVCDPSLFEALLPYGSYRLGLLPPAVHPAVLDQGVEPERRNGVVIVGEPDDRGAAIARAVLEADVSLRLFGSGWSLHPDLVEYSFGRVAYCEMGTVLAGAELHLELPVPVSTQAVAGISAWEAPVSQSTLDAAAVATPTLALERAGVSSMFTPGLDIATFVSDSDVAQLVPMLLSDAVGLRAMAQAAADTVRSTALWTQRWSALFSPFETADDDGDLVVASAMVERTAVSI
ncbi:MAG: glycosyltransferase family 1 protein [Actinomycetia bacterium]|nr:glycosyltransferase family 1 protein [Actinomycetes bacterium]MCP4960636.1 glycosyltransferase family 1 protein [Actinomycetes bacterium]